VVSYLDKRTNSQRAFSDVPYSQKTNALVTEGKNSLFGNKNTNSLSASRTIGQKQYELVNHLGNVQLTTLDRLTPNTVTSAGVVSDTVINWYADASNVYDHYPFGMQMPGRVLGDNSEHCADITYFQYLPTKVSTTHWDTINGYTLTNTTTVGSFTTTGAQGGYLSQYSGSLGFYYHSDPDEFATGGAEVTVATNVGQDFLASFSFSPTDFQGNYCDEVFIAQVVGITANGDPEILSEILLQGAGVYQLAYTANGPTASIQILATQPNSAFWFHTYSWTVDEITYTQQQVTKTFCSGDGDYRFGFNGMEKDNEIKGKGNSLDFGARLYDSRLARWTSLDPLMTKFPSHSPYNFVANSPIIYMDEDGKDISVHGVSAIKYKAQLQQKTTLTVHLNEKTGQVTFSGIPLTDVDFDLLRASKDPSIHVHIYTTEKHIVQMRNGNQGWLRYGAFDGSKVINGVAHTFQYVNPSHGFGADEAIPFGGPGTAAAHELLESYYAAQVSPGHVPIVLKKDEKDNVYEFAHKKVVSRLGHWELQGGDFDKDNCYRFYTFRGNAAMKPHMGPTLFKKPKVNTYRELADETFLPCMGFENQQNNGNIPVKSKGKIRKEKFKKTIDKIKNKLRSKGGETNIDGFGNF